MQTVLRPESALYRTGAALAATLCLMGEGETAADRLRHTRMRLGFDTAAAFARAHELPEATYRSHENGTRGLSRGYAARYAKLMKIDCIWLLTGRAPASALNATARHDAKPLGATPPAGVTVALHGQATGEAGDMESEVVASLVRYIQRLESENEMLKRQQRGRKGNPTKGVPK